MKRIWLICLLVLSSCGDPTDNPEDCTSGEFFDQARQLCFTCPALREPVCEAGCGFEILKDEDNDCPVAECLTQDMCVCDAGAFFSQNSLSCQDCVESPGCTAENGVQVISDDTCTLQCE